MGDPTGDDRSDDGPGEDDAALGRAAALARAWRAGLADRPVAAGVTADAVRDRLPATLPEDGEDAVTVLDTLADALDPGLVASGGPRYFGFVTGGALPVALAADWLTSAYDQNAATAVMSPAAAAVEAVAASWVLELLGLPASSTVGFVTGAQMATVSCLAAARHALLAAQGWDVGADGLAGAPVPTVVVGAQVHATVLQGLRLLGLGTARALRVGVDREGRMRPDDLRARLDDVTGPVLVCAQAGHVDTGAVDPLDAIADVVADTVAGREHAWLHVDGAFGLWSAASPSRRHLVAGVERADSWGVDAHKWLNVPYDAAMAIVRHPGALAPAMASSAAYLSVDERDATARVPESSRRARGLPVYAALRGLGRRGVAELVDRCCALARQAADELGRHPAVTILNDVVLNQVVFRVGGRDEAGLAALVAAIQHDGTCWVGATRRDDRPAVRFSVSNFSTTPADVTRATGAIVALIGPGSNS